MSDKTKEINQTAEEAANIGAEKSAEVMEKFEKESRTRVFEQPWLRISVYVLCLLFTLYHLAYASGIRLLQMVNIKERVGQFIGLMLMVI